MRVVVVDDEAPARAKLRRLLAAAGVSVVGEFADGVGAVQGLAALAPDVVFLDVQMPGLTGLQVAAQLELQSAPLVVFVTAHDAHALAAFDLNAVDYLLKPYDEERFARALDRVRERLQPVAQQRKSQCALPGVPIAAVAMRGAAIRTARAQAGISDRLLVPMGEGLRLIDTADILCLEADDNYVTVYSGTQQFVLRRTLSDLIEQLGERRFVRIHKSTAVNIAFVDTLSPLFKGDYEIGLRGGRTLRMSRRYTVEFFARTGR